jgi:hypothetical protein
VRKRKNERSTITTETLIFNKEKKKGKTRKDVGVNKRSDGLGYPSEFI